MIPTVRKFGPLSAKPMMADPRTVTHRLQSVVGNDRPIVFNWVFPKGALEPRMSAMELGEFIFSHMPYVIPFLADYPVVQAEFIKMMGMLGGSLIRDTTLVTTANGQLIAMTVNKDSEGWQRYRKRVIAATDRLLPWIRSVVRKSDQDVIVLSLDAPMEQKCGPTYFF